MCWYVITIKWAVPLCVGVYHSKTDIVNNMESDLLSREDCRFTPLKINGVHLCAGDVGVIRPLPFSYEGMVRTATMIRDDGKHVLTFKKIY